MSERYLDFWDKGGSVGGFVRLAVEGTHAEVWAYLVRDGEPLLAVRDSDVPAPRSSPEVRSSGLWLAIHEETAGEHWSVGLEAFAVALDDPDDALIGERGDLVAFGLDLEWEGPDDDLNVVHGDVLVGSDTIAFEGRGRRYTVTGDGAGSRVVIPRPDGSAFVRVLTPDGWVERASPGAGAGSRRV